MTLNPWFAKGAILAASVAMVVIRAPHGQRSRTVKVARHRKGGIERALLTLAWISFFVPLIWIATPAFAFADYPLRPVPFVTGVALFVVSLALFHRTHADLGTNWSVTLEIRENHRLVTEGIYRRIRHPMYSSLLLYSVAQALVIPNGVAGPSYLVALGLLVAFRLGPEEEMMRAEFGDAYRGYAARTRRLIPGIW